MDNLNQTKICGCDCHSCQSMCLHKPSKKGYWIRHFLILVFGVIAAFLVGFHLGEVKASIHYESKSM